MQKIKLPLEMANGVMVRTLDELKENWDLEKIVGYFGDGRLVTWLNDRYYTDLAEQVQKITAKGAEAQRQLCEVFGIEFKQDEVVDAEELAERKRKLDILRQFTSDDEILKNADHVAFDQEDLADLLDEGVEKIYLCNGKFSVPFSLKNKEYIGLGDVEVSSSDKKSVNLAELEIKFINVRFEDSFFKNSEGIRLYEEGNKAFEKKDYKKALELYKQAAENNIPEAICQVGYIYDYGKGVKKNYAEAFKWYTKAEALGNKEAIAHLGWLYCNGQGVLEDYATAWKKFNLVPCLPNAMNGIACMYRYGRIVDKDYSKALEWYTKSAELNDNRAMLEIGDMYYSGEGVEQNYAEAVRWYEKSAEAGSEEAMNALGNLCYWGEGVEQNYAEAVRWYEKGADAGSKRAMDNLGNCYYNGQGVEQNYDKAIEFYTRAAEMGSDFAMNNLGDVYRDIDTKKNYTLAYYWNRAAADLGNATALNTIGLMHWNGEGVPCNYSIANDYFRKAAEAGKAVSMRNLAYSYESGTGIEKNLELAIEWYIRAAKAGYEDAKKDVSRLCNGKDWETVAKEKSLL